jgi:hypothetical protein
VFSVVMVLGTGPAEPLALVGGVVLVAVTRAPFGLAVGALAANELERAARAGNDHGFVAPMTRYSAG